MRQSFSAVRRRFKASLCVLLLLPGCETLGITGSGRPTQGVPGFVRGFLGGVAAEEPRAALAAREVLSAGGNAADAAVALGFALSVTLPSRAGLGGGGVCVALSRERNETVAFDFQARAPASPDPAADRPAAVPLLARGLFAVQARMGGRLQFERLVSPSEAMARFGVPASRSFAADLAPVAALLARDPEAGEVFAPRGNALAEGDQLVQSQLANTLGTIRTLGPGDFHQGALARRLAEGSVQAGGGITVADLRAAVPRAEPAASERVGNDLIFLAPGPGSIAALAALKAGASGDANARAAAVLNAVVPAPAAPASTAFAVLDREGNAVACALTMNNLFGTGRMVPGTGMLLAAAPTGRIAAPLLPVLLVANDRVRAFRYVAAASGGASAPGALAAAAARTLGGLQPVADAVAAPRPGLPQGEGRVVAINCWRYLPGDAGQCGWAADPRSSGLAVGGD